MMSFLLFKTVTSLQACIHKLNVKYINLHGLPQHFYTDGGKDFRSNHLQQIGVQLGFV